MDVTVKRKQINKKKRKEKKTVILKNEFLLQAEKLLNRSRGTRTATEEINK